MRSIPFRLNSTAIRSLKGSAAVATLTAALLSSGLQAADTYDGATGQVTAPVVRVGDDYYRDVVITVGSIVSIGEAAEGDAKYDTFNGATGQLTIPAITDGTIFAYNVVVTLGALISQGGKCESLADCLGEISISGGDRTVADTDGVDGELVNFTTTVTDSDGTVATSQWLIDDAVVATGLSATIPLPNGSSVVTFTATDNDGASTSASVTVTVGVPDVPNIPPTAAISGGDRTVADTDGVDGELVNFTTTVTDSDGTVATSQWLIDDAVVATGLSATIPLPNGSSVVTLTATDNDGASTSASVTVTVGVPDVPNIPPTAAISGGDRTVADTDGVDGELVNFTTTVTDSDGTVATSQWLIDDAVVATGLSATIPLPNGSSVVTLTATDNDGASTSASVTVTVGVPDVPNIPPTAAISGGDRTVADTDGVDGELVNFTTTVTDSDGTVATSQWLIDDAVVATGLSATIPLPNGSSVVTLTATDNDGASTSASVTVTVGVPDVPNIPPTAAISGGDRTVADTDGVDGELVNFTTTVTDSDGTVATSQWLIDDAVVATGLSATIPLPNGSSVVTLTATDNDGASTSASVTVTVGVPDASDHAIFYGAAPFAEWVETSYSTDSLTLTTNLSTPARVMISDAPTLVSDANYLSIGDALTNFSGYSAQALGIDSDSTYRTYYSKLLRLEAETSDSSCYRLRSHLHPNFALDVDEDDFDNLKFRNNFGNTATSYGYVCFTYDKSARLLRAKTRYNYSAADFTYTQDSSFARGNYYVKLGNGGYSLVASSSEATKLYIYDSPLDFSVPFDFNPAKTTPVTNPAAAYISKPADFNISRLGSEYTAQVKVDGVAAPGTNATTRTAADAMLLKIENSLASGESLRYDIKVYAAFRDGLLASTLQSDGISNGELGQNLVPYVFFTNEKDSSGVSHPYMVIMSYGNPGSPHGLMDVPRPPGLGTGSYDSSSVTRFTNLDRYSIGIPMKDYGEVSAVDENASVLSNQLWDDVSGSKGARDVFNYASANDNGIMISGAVMFPVYNNRLMPSQADAELSANGCHVGQGGGGPHCHADGYESQGVLGVYTDADYEGKEHPPLVGFGYDGVALFGVYREDQDSQLEGFGTALDAWGGHEHDSLGYHYHADRSKSLTLSIPGAAAATYRVRSLILGAYKGKLTGTPYFVSKKTGNDATFLGGI